MLKPQKKNKKTIKLKHTEVEAVSSTYHRLFCPLGFFSASLPLPAIRQLQGLFLFLKIAAPSLVLWQSFYLFRLSF